MLVSLQQVHAGQLLGLDLASGLDQAGQRYPEVGGLVGYLGDDLTNAD